MKVIDSSGWVEYFRQGALASAYRPYLLAQNELITPSITLYEVVKKVLVEEGEKSAAEAAGYMRKTRIVPLDDVLAISAARLSVKHKLPMADAIIYATAQSVGGILVTSDEHFEGLPGVEYIPQNK